jgi:hypothetical protein
MCEFAGQVESTDDLIEWVNELMDSICGSDQRMNGLVEHVDYWLWL